VDVVFVVCGLDLNYSICLYSLTDRTLTGAR
jgi:hypothetical protein